MLSGASQIKDDAEMLNLADGNVYMKRNGSAIKMSDKKEAQKLKGDKSMSK